MSLTAGTRLGPYEVLAKLGEGGMGEVYRARDLKLGRDVALKILPDIFAADPERLTRFEREAQVLASLSHANIGAIHGLEESPAEDGHQMRALVLELVEGPTLADRIASSALPLEESLDIARQIADALEAAHDRGIVHRDLKPANIKVRPDGAVKVLDFGLAKLASDEGARSSLVTNSPTLTMQATYAGMILGTAAYMSPEQAKGKAVDRRADIWAFGVVFAEMLTGGRMYDGETAPETLARVIEREPDLNELPASTPDSIRSLLARCLTKDPRSRLQAIGEARIVIERAIAGGNAAPTIGAPVQAGHARGTWKQVLPWMATAVALLVLAAVWLLRSPRQTQVARTPIRMTVAIGADASLRTDAGTAAVLSADGQTLAFAAEDSGKSRLYVRRLDQLQATALAGTDDAYGPFFSPDGQWIAFFAGGKLKKVSIGGGAVVTLCDAPNGRGGFWTEDNTIVLQPNAAAPTNNRFVRVAAAGGVPEPLDTEADETGRGRYPQVLPGGRALLFSRTTGRGNASVMLQSLATGDRRELLPGSHGRYVSSGHILYLQESTLFAVPFDVERLELNGQAVPMIEGISATPATAAQFAVSDTGTLVYVPSTDVNGEPPIVWLTRDGKTTSLRAQPADWSNLRFSPDGRTLAMSIVDGTNEDVFTYDWERNALTKLTFDAAVDQRPVWTPDSRRIVFSSSRGPAGNGVSNLYWQRADGTGEVQRLTESSQQQSPGSWHPSGKFLAFSQFSRSTNPDLWILPIEGDETSGWKPGQPTLFANTPLNESAPAFSPDGRWIAYQAAAGRSDVYVRAFPGPGGPWQVSFDNGSQPRWSRTRSELFYLSNGRIMMVPYRVEGNSFRADAARVWSDARVPQRPRGGWEYDLHPDGTRFAVAPMPDQNARTKQDTVVVVFNFFDELRRLAPAAK